MLWSHVMIVFNAWTAL